MMLSQNFSTNYNWKSLGQRLILENCLLFGLHPRLTSKKITKYLLGTRNTLEIFKLYELRYLLLKIYPLVHILFHNPRVNPRFKLQPLKTKPTKPRKAKQKFMDSKKKKLSPQKTVFSFKHKNLPPQILFATTTEIFSDIISQAANICNMPHHTKRWVNGTITAAIWNIYTKDFWHYTSDSVHKDVFSHFDKSWHHNKENSEKIKEKKKYYGRSRWPSLVIIPDISNNHMILSEITKIGIPVMGLVNSHCTLEIDYPVFAQDQTISSVYFFCHFLATLIAKEMVYSQHKHYTLQKIQFREKKIRNKVKKKLIKKTKNNFFWQSFKRRKFQKDFKKIEKLAFFFKAILPLKTKFRNQHSLSKLKVIYSAKKWRYRLFFGKRKKKLGYKRLSNKLRVISPLKPKFYKKRFWEKAIFAKNKKSSRKKKGRNVQLLYTRDKKRYKTRPSLRNYFLGLMRYFKHRKCDSFFFNRYKNVSQLLIKLQKKDLGPTKILWNKEEKKKYFGNQRRNNLLKGDEANLRKNRLPGFLWMFKTQPLYWKQKMLARKSTFFTDSSYYWEQIFNLSSAYGSNWGDYKYFWPRLLGVKGKIKKTWNQEKRAQEKKKYLYKKHHQNNKVPFAKKPWKVWVNKNTKPEGQNKPRKFLSKPKKTYKTYNAKKN